MKWWRVQPAGQHSWLYFQGIDEMLPFSNRHVSARDQARAALRVSVLSARVKLEQVDGLPAGSKLVGKASALGVNFELLHGSAVASARRNAAAFALTDSRGAAHRPELQRYQSLIRDLADAAHRRRGVLLTHGTHNQRLKSTGIRQLRSGGYGRTGRSAARPGTGN